MSSRGRTDSLEQSDDEVFARTHRKATFEDFEEYKIPSHYDPKNWDPDERPILLADSIYDGFSLGAWVYRLTATEFGAEACESELAGNLWRDLIRLAARLKRAKRGRVRAHEDCDWELLDDWRRSGFRIWQSAEALFGRCEWYMWEDDTETILRHDSGQQFVGAMFGSEFKLEETENLLSKLERWIVAFDKDATPVYEKVRKVKEPAPTTSSSSKSGTSPSDQKAPPSTVPAPNNPSCSKSGTPPCDQKAPPSAAPALGTSFSSRSQPSSSRSQPSSSRKHSSSSRKHPSSFRS